MVFYTAKYASGALSVYIDTATGIIYSIAEYITTRTTVIFTDTAYTLLRRCI